MITPVPFGVKVKLMLLSPPVDAIEGAEPVALFVIVISFTAEAVFSNIAISLSEESLILTLPSAAPPVPPLIRTSPELFEPVPLPPFNTRSPASPDDETPPETVNEVSSSPITIEAPP